MNDKKSEGKIKDTPADDRLPSRSGFTAERLDELAGRQQLSDPLNVQLRLIKGHRSNGKTLT